MSDEKIHPIRTRTVARASRRGSCGLAANSEASLPVRDGTADLSVPDVVHLPRPNHLGLAALGEIRNFSEALR